MKLGVMAVSMIAPGVANWAAAEQLFKSGAGYDLSQPLVALAPSLLPANERRRTTTLIKLALQCGQDVIDQWSGDIKTAATVFASSGGDLDIVDRILRSLGEPGKPVSPTHFHNSVHNAPAGYWSIAAQARAASTSISAYDGSFVAGLLEAGTQLMSDGGEVLLVAYDIPPPPILFSFRPIVAPFATALLLAQEDAPGVVAKLQLRLSEAAAVTSLEDAALESLRCANPAARALPLLQRLATQQAGAVALPYLPGLTLNVDVIQN